MNHAPANRLMGDSKLETIRHLGWRIECAEA